MVKYFGGGGCAEIKTAGVIIALSMPSGLSIIDLKVVGGQWSVIWIQNFVVIIKVFAPGCNLTPFLPTTDHRSPTTFKQAVSHALTNLCNAGVAARLTK